MTKKILVMILAVCLAITAMTTMAMTYGSESDGWVFDSGVLTVYSNSGMNGWGNYRDVVMSQMTTLILKDGVTEIPEEAFIKCGQLSSVTLPSTLTSIGEDAFNSCDSLTSITIPSTVTSIGENAFSGCTSLASAVLDCSTTYYSTSFPSTTTITLTHTYSGGVCSVCGASEPDYVTLGSLKLYDGYYTTDGSTEIAGMPGSSVTSYAYFADGTLTLCGYDVTATISYDGALKIVLIDENSVTATNSDGISVTGDLTISGTGSLEVEMVDSDNNEVYGIVSTSGNVTISETTITVAATANNQCWWSYAIYAKTGITIANSTVNAEATSENYAYVIYSSGDITITKDSDVTVVATSTDYAHGFYCSSNIVIEGNSTVSITATSTGSNGYARDIYAKGNITITDSTIENAEATGYSHDAIVCRGSNGITLTNSEAVIVGGIVVDGSFTVTAGTSMLEVIAGADSASAAAKYYVAASGTLTITNTTWQSDWSGYEYVEIALHTHAYNAGVVTKAATCAETGVRTYTCSSCGESYTEVIAKTAHTAAEAVKESEVSATCTTDGSYDSVVYCSACNEELSRETITVLATGHTEITDLAVEPTCTETGLTEGSHCSVCNEVFVAQTVVAATGHSYEAVITEPTCAEGGYTTYTCSVCGDSYVADETAATGHSYTVSWSWDGTSAMATVSCSDCGDSYEQKATITTQSNYGQTIYIAIVRVGDVTYTTSKTTGTITIPTTDSTSEVITEEVETEEPVEGTDTETEADEEAKTNPTTGMVLALLPMAIAMAGAVAGKKRLG